MAMRKQTKNQEILKIPLHKIVIDGTQPRKHFDKQTLDELSQSIKEHGLLQPILVRPKGDGTFQIVHGERRYRAHQKANLRTIKCIVEEMEDSEVANARIAENVMREDLTDIELAWEFKRRIDAGETHQQIAKSIKKSRAYVTQRLALLKLSKEQQMALEQKRINFAEARQLAMRPSDSPNLTLDKSLSYAVTIENLEVYKLFQSDSKPSLEILYNAYRKDMAQIRRAIH